MFNQYPLASKAGTDTSRPLTLLSSHQQERVVKDQVRARPVRDQYADIAKASERLNAGQSVLSNMHLKQPEPA